MVTAVKGKLTGQTWSSVCTNKLNTNSCSNKSFFHVTAKDVICDFKKKIYI